MEKHGEGWRNSEKNNEIERKRWVVNKRDTEGWRR